MRDRLLVALVLAAALAAARGAGAQGSPPVQIGGRAGIPATNASKPATDGAPFSVRYGVDVEGLAPAAQLPALDPAGLIEADAQATSGDKVMRTGVGREVTVRGNAGHWQRAGTHGWLWVADLVSPRALAVRLHIDQLALPPGAQLIVWAPGHPDLIAGPYEGRGPSNDGTLWTRPVQGEHARVEVFVPGDGDRPADAPLVIDQLIHVYRDPLDKSAEGVDEGTCHNDVTCYPAWASLSRAVGRIDFVKSGSSYLCTGQLLNDLNGDLTPYFLLANHCFNTQASAASAVIYWDYQTSSCNGTVPSLGAVASSSVCTWLSSGAASDYTLVMVEGSLAGAVVYWAGWTTAGQSDGTAVTGIHHPGGAYKRISFGNKASNTTCGGGDHLRVNWNSGVTEPGSSGSGIFTDAGQYLIGQLHCGTSACGAVASDQHDDYGAFSTTYGSISGYLAAGSDDALENNDACASAHATAPGYYPGLIVKSTDPDWYSINVPGGSHLTVTLSFTHAYGDIDCQLWNGCGGSVLATSAGVSNTETINWDNVGGATTVYLNAYLYSDVRNQYDMNVAIGTLPNLNATVTPGGFSSPAVPRNLNNSALFNAPLTSTLDGNTTDTYLNWAIQQEGPGNVGPAWGTELWLDEQPLASGGVGPNSAPASYQALNVGPVNVRGGRHSLTSYVDLANAVAESNEFDNVWRGQWVWTPYALSDQTPIARAVPPLQGYFANPNCDGFTFTGNWWACIGIVPTNTNDDYDLLLYGDYANSTTGFSTFQAGSGWGQGYSDFVIVNGNMVGFGATRYAAVTRYGAPVGASYLIHESNQVAATLFPGTGYNTSVVTPVISMGGSDIVKLHEVYLGSTTTTYTFTLENLSGTADLDMGLYAASAAYDGKTSYVASSQSGGSSAETFDYQPPSAGYYAVVVWKRGTGDVGLANTYQLRVGPTLGDVTTQDTPGGWTAPVVPRNDGLTNGLVSATLDGNTNDTQVLWAYHTIAPNGIAGTESRLFFDEDFGGFYWFAGLPGGSGNFFNSIGTGTNVIRGGRHTLITVADYNAAVVEKNELNNTQRNQYVWSPLLTTKNVPVTRIVPPNTGLFAQPNADGLQFNRSPSYAWVVGIGGTNAADDYDLLVYSDYAGSTSGFSTFIGGSGFGALATDFVVGHYSGTPNTVYPAAIRFAAGAGDGYVADQTDAVGRNGPGTGAVFAGQVMAANRLVDVYEAFFNAANNYDIGLRITAGTPDLAFAVYDGTPGTIRGRSGALGYSNPLSPTLDTLGFHAVVDGWHPIVVYRTTTTDLSPVTYTLRWGNTPLVGVPPGGASTLSFAGAAPNPVTDATRFGFSLPAADHARLALYDLTGRLVRVVLDGSFEAGRHDIAWDRLQDDGTRARAGLYWAQLETGGRTLTRRVSVLP